MYYFEDSENLEKSYCLIEVGQTKSVALCNWPECVSKTSVSQVLEDKERWISSLVYRATCKFYF